MRGGRLVPTNGGIVPPSRYPNGMPPAGEGDRVVIDGRVYVMRGWRLVPVLSQGGAGRIPFTGREKPGTLIGRVVPRY